jgi:enoyl-CoA hydratase
MSDVLVRVSGSCGRITLNRPRALNALTLEMVNIMHAALMTWAHDVSIQFVLVDGAGERGLCAGGDIRAMYNAVIADRRDLATDFFRNEYRLNYLISRYPKPYVALMDGIVMGGGIGISAHASHRIVTERSELAMPETAIGFVPDVGGTHLLGTAPDELGTYLALTGSRIGAADAVFCRLADTVVLSGDLLILTSHLEKCENLIAVDDAIRAYTNDGVLQNKMAETLARRCVGQRRR